MDALLNILLLNMQYNLPPVHRTPTQSTRRQRRDERRPRLPPRPPALPTSGKYNGGAGAAAAASQIPWEKQKCAPRARSPSPKIDLPSTRNSGSLSRPARPLPTPSTLSQAHPSHQARAGAREPHLPSPYPSQAGRFRKAMGNGRLVCGTQVGREGMREDEDWGWAGALGQETHRAGRDDDASGPGGG